MLLARTQMPKGQDSKSESEILEGQDPWQQKARSAKRSAASLRGLARKDNLGMCNSSNYSGRPASPIEQVAKWSHHVRQGNAHISGRAYEY